MPITYSVVARGTTILAEYSAQSGNYNALVKKILEKIPATNNRQTYTYESYDSRNLLGRIFPLLFQILPLWCGMADIRMLFSHYIHYSVVDGIVYLCVADEAFSRNLAFAYLDDIKNRFTSTYPKSQNAVAFAYQTDFSRVMKQVMAYYSDDANADRIKRVQNQIYEVRGVMQENIEKLLDRGEKIELLVDKTENLAQSSLSFQKQSTSLKRAMWYKNVKIIIIIVVLVILLAYVIAAIACKGIIFQGCWPQPAAPVAPPVAVPVPMPPPVGAPAV